MAVAGAVVLVLVATNSMCVAEMAVYNDRPHFMQHRLMYLPSVNSETLAVMVEAQLLWQMLTT